MVYFGDFLAQSAWALISILLLAIGIALVLTALKWLFPLVRFGEAISGGNIAAAIVVAAAIVAVAVVIGLAVRL